MSVIEKIISHKRKEIEQLKKDKPLDKIVTSFNLYPNRRFSAAISQNNKINIIAELKKASPSLGIIRADFDPINIAHIYEEGGAVAISVLTEKKFFCGDISFLPDVKMAVNLPILRKDFIIDSYQIYESKLYGADAILLITSILSLNKLKEFITLIYDLGMEALVEIHNEADLEKALKADAKIIGVNNRDLKTLKVDLKTSLKLVSKIPKEKIKVAESGINNSKDILTLKNAGFQAFLIGTSFMKAKDIKAKLKEFLTICE